jgi:hypothetical protein
MRFVQPGLSLLPRHRNLEGTVAEGYAIWFFQMLRGQGALPK